MITPQHFFWRTRHGLFHRDQCIRRHRLSPGGAELLLPLCAAPGAVVRQLSGRRRRRGGCGRRPPLSPGKDLPQHAVLRCGHQLCLLSAGAGPHRAGVLFQRLPGVVRPGQRRHHPALRPVPAGPWKAVPGAGAGAPSPLPAGQAGHEPGHGPGAGLHLQLRLDALRGPHPQQRIADGLLGGVLCRRLSAHRRVHPGVRAALPSGGPLHRRGAGLLQVPSECGALHGEDRRGAADPPPAASPPIWPPSPARSRRPLPPRRRTPPPAAIRTRAGRPAAKRRRMPRALWSPPRTSP